MINRLTHLKFSNLLGTVYCKGNLVFTPDGTCLLSPVGNRVTVFDLVHTASPHLERIIERLAKASFSNTSYTLPAAHRKNISRIALNPRGNLLLSVDDDGRAILTHFHRRIVLHHLSFKASVAALAFSPSGQHFAVAYGRFVEVWQTPSTPDSNSDGVLEFAPFVKHHTHAGHHDTVQSISWSSDSRFFLTTSKDLTARLWSLDLEVGFVPTTLAGHRQEVRAAWFSHDQETIYTVSKDGALFDWKYLGRPDLDDDTIMDEGHRWRIAEKHYFLQNNAALTCAAYHAPSNLLVAGFSNGVFVLYELPDFNQIHTLSISQNDIDFVEFNSTGEWLAFGASRHGQLLVWEWQSESYILKQQGHFDSMNAITYSPDGQKIITTADDGKIKVWDVNSGFCIVTFTEHTSGVTACEFAKRGNVLFTASLDGSVRAWDLIRYRNFRTFTAPTRLSFSSLAVDPSGEVVCAGSLEDFDIHIWSVQTGQLLDQLAGHEGPVSSLSFAPVSGSLVSGSWDHTVRVWDIFARSQTSEPLQLQADVLSVAYRPDAKQVAVATLDGNLTFWSVSDATQAGGVDARRDVSGGRKLADRRTAANVAGTKHFNNVAYSADGTCVLAGGNSKYICLYDVQSAVLLKKFTVSINLSLDGTQEYLNSKLLTEAGPQGLIDEQGEASDLEDRIDRSLPGSKRGVDAATRQTRPEVRVTGVAFSPTGRSFCAASTEGLLIYSLDKSLQFDPFDLDIDITPETILSTVKSKDYLKALIMAFRLNDPKLLRHVYESVPPADVDLLVRDLPNVYMPTFLRFVALATDDSPHLEFNLIWLEALLSKHGRWMKENQGSLGTELRLVQRAVKRIQTELGRLTDDNAHSIDYLLEAGSGGRKLAGKALMLGDDEELTIEQVMNGGFKINGHGEDTDEISIDEEEDEGDWIGIED